MHRENWNDIRLVRELHRGGSLSKAAEELGVQHSTLSRRLKALEDKLGTRLFERVPKGVQATTAGLAVVEVAQRMEEQLQDLGRDLFGLDAQLSGVLRVTMVEVFARRLAPVFVEFSRKYPQVKLELVVDNATRSLTKREADVAVRVTNNPPEHLVGRKVQHLDYALYAAENLIEEFGPDPTVEDYPWMAWDPTAGAHVTEAWMRTHAPKVRIACSVNDTIAMLAGVESGLGAGFMSCVLADEVPNLRQIRPPEPGFGVDLWLLTHSDLRQSARVRAFMDLVWERMRDQIATGTD
jgi:DNA-binding transcriptional LysR family regulator